MCAVFARSADEDALNEQVLTTVFAADSPLVALDWQHTSYWFRPHRQVVEGRSWRVSAFPNGGDLIEALVPELALWLPVRRSN